MGWTAPHKASKCRRVIVDDGRDRNRPRLAVGKGFPFPLFRLRNGFTVSPWRTFAEACGSAHYWAREIAKLGHTVKLMPPKYVKAYVKRGKTDAGDAAAICEAVMRPSMSFVPVKGLEQQGLSMLHSALAAGRPAHAAHQRRARAPERAGHHRGKRPARAGRAGS